MLIRKLRLQRGWSQEHLAQLTGLNTRTIQRVERGKPPSLETLNSLAAVFEIELNQLQEGITMDTESRVDLTEQKAIEHVQGIKGFYTHLTIYVGVLFIFLIINLFDSPAEFWVHLPAMGWGTGILIHGLCVFETFNLLGPDWEKRQIEKRLGRKL
ncbi:helix-turn-helix domain-containing protein [Shewanella sp. AS16]|uniref:helix-turn-helix domain-containing protein n=1 Tax=Shewanella sp. AS16 TaxID=2907625 RepID=UPI001F297F1A|nr:helix-turn-helix domain-containing protein [Shewanella sp. AS16]MCE9687858.1 helix-turn-helix domain-containing protein [Shewanella sp. AS16]